MNIRIASFVLLALAATAAAAEGPAPAAGSVEQKAQVCVACHGPQGAKPILPEYPILAGQHASYLEHALTEYQQGKRKNPVMTAQAAALSAEDIEALAEYFSLQPSALYTPSVHASGQASAAK